MSAFVFDPFHDNVTQLLDTEVKITEHTMNYFKCAIRWHLALTVQAPHYAAPDVFIPPKGTPCPLSGDSPPPSLGGRELLQLPAAVPETASLAPVPLRHPKGQDTLGSLGTRSAGLPPSI